MIFISGVISIIIQKNKFCTTKICVIYVHLFIYFFLGGGEGEGDCNLLGGGEGTTYKKVNIESDDVFEL